MKVNKTEYQRVVVDTNVLLSAALLPNSKPAILVDWLLINPCLVFSKNTFSELEKRIWKPKFDRYLTNERRIKILELLNATAYWYEIPPEISQLKFSRDPKDDPFIHLALTAQCQRLISGDEDLLCLNPLGELQIINPNAALIELNLIPAA
ncbi:MAG: putative toxin-antitoxin system toxin component, PIN family [Thiotrichaceae bacterium]